MPPMHVLPTELAFVAPFLCYAAVTAGIGMALFRWDIGSTRLNLPQRLWYASLAPGILSLVLGLVTDALWYVHIRPIVAIHPIPHMISAACLMNTAIAIPVYMALDRLALHLWKPGFLRYRDRNAQLPR